MIKCKCGSEKYHEEKRGQHIAAICDKCQSWIKFIPQNPPQFYAGKYKGKLLSEISDVEYLQWYLDNVKCSSTFRSALIDRINYINEQSR